MQGNPPGGQVNDRDQDGRPDGASNRDPPRPKVVRRRSIADRVRQSTGNDLVVTALVAAVIAQLVPLGLILNALSLFMLARVFLSGSRPSPFWRFLSVTIALWNIYCFARVILFVYIFTEFQKTSGQ
jgi:hypothetical protein